MRDLVHRPLPLPQPGGEDVRLGEAEGVEVDPGVGDAVGRHQLPPGPPNSPDYRRPGHLQLPHHTIPAWPACGLVPAPLDSASPAGQTGKVSKDYTAALKVSKDCCAELGRAAAGKAVVSPLCPCIGGQAWRGKAGTVTGFIQIYC